MGENGWVAWMFDKHCYIVVSKTAADEQRLIEVALEAGAEDIREDGGRFEVLCAPEAFEAVKATLEDAKITSEVAEVTMLPQTNVALTGKEAEQMLRLMDMLDDCEDVQKVYTNADIPEDMLDEA